jgi:hypothetical protein
MASPWTLEKELCGLTKTRSVHEALWRLGIVNEPASETVFKEVQAWTRDGAETFTYRFRVISPGPVKDVLLKAIVAFSTTRSLAEISHEWVSRRQLLEQFGIRTPTLYRAAGALLVEQFIPHKLSDYLREEPQPTKGLIDQVIQIAATLENCGFCPIAAFHGLRTDGENVFAVDCGQDLGPPGLTAKRNGRMLREAIRWLNSNCGSSQPIDERHARALFAFHAAGAKNEGRRWI